MLAVSRMCKHTAERSWERKLYVWNLACVGEKVPRERKKAVVSQRVTQKVLRNVFLLSILYE